VAVQAFLSATTVEQILLILTQPVPHRFNEIFFYSFIYFVVLQITSRPLAYSFSAAEDSSKMLL